MREEDLPEALEQMGFLEWERHRERLAAALADSSDPAARYRDIILITNVMNSQYELVKEQIADGEKASRDWTSESDPGFAEAKEFVDWAKPWLAKLESKFAQYATERDKLQKSMPEDDRDRVETEFQGKWEEITEDIKAVLMTRMEKLQAEVGSAATSNAADMKVCPDCAEEIKAAARRCRYCGYRFDGQTS